MAPAATVVVWPPPPPPTSSLSPPLPGPPSPPSVPLPPLSPPVAPPPLPALPPAAPLLQTAIISIAGVGLLFAIIAFCYAICAGWIISCLVPARDVFYSKRTEVRKYNRLREAKGGARSPTRERSPSRSPNVEREGPTHEPIRDDVRGEANGSAACEPQEAARPRSVSGQRRGSVAPTMPQANEACEAVADASGHAQASSPFHPTQCVEPEVAQDEEQPPVHSHRSSAFMASKAAERATPRSARSYATRSTPRGTPRSSPQPNNPMVRLALYRSYVRPRPDSDPGPRGRAAAVDAETRHEGRQEGGSPSPPRPASARAAPRERYGFHG